MIVLIHNESDREAARTFMTMMMEKMGMLGEELISVSEKGIDRDLCKTGIFFAFYGLDEFAPEKILHHVIMKSLMRKDVIVIPVALRTGAKAPFGAASLKGLRSCQAFTEGKKMDARLLKAEVDGLSRLVRRYSV